MDYKFENIVFCERNEIASYIDKYDKVLVVGSKYIINIKGANSITIPDGEQAKTMDVVQILWDIFTKFGINKRSLVLSVGGGSVSDAVGFAASTYMRGVHYSSVPTTLLSMIDASIGGKRAINSGAYKNLIGSYYCADNIFIDTKYLDSLEDKELKSAYAEAIKLSVLAGTTLPKDIKELIEFCIQIKQDIVSKDYFDRKNIRAILNYGHSLGHAVESITNFDIAHGIAVALGMDFATFVFPNPKVKNFQDSLFIEYSIDKDIAEIRNAIDKSKVDDIICAMKKDKKIREEGLNFVYMQDIGCAKVINVSFDKLTQNLIDYFK